MESLDGVVVLLDGSWMSTESCCCSESGGFSVVRDVSLLVLESAKAFNMIVF